MTDLPDLTANEVKELIQTNNITFINIHSCSMCNYPCGYIIEGDNLSYDSGCYCVRSPSGPHPRTFADLANNHNMQSNELYNGKSWRQRYLDAFSGINTPDIPIRKA